MGSLGLHQLMVNYKEIGFRYVNILSNEVNTIKLLSLARIWKIIHHWFSQDAFKTMAIT